MMIDREKAMCRRAVLRFMPEVVQQGGILLPIDAAEERRRLRTIMAAMLAIVDQDGTDPKAREAFWRLSHADQVGVLATVLVELDTERLRSITGRNR